MLLNINLMLYFANILKIINVGNTLL